MDEAARVRTTALSDRSRGPAGRSLDDELLLLGERDALRRHFDTTNARVLARLLVAFAVVAGIYAIILLSSGALGTGAVAVANVIVCVVARRSLARRAGQGRVRALTAALFLAQYVLLLVYEHGSVADLRFWAVALPLLVLLLRFDATELALLLAGLFAVAAGPTAAVWLFGAGTAASQASASGGVLLTQLNVSVVAFALGMALRHRASRRFLAWWRSEVERHHDRLRMKQELEHARDIQLSMLPRKSPAFDWLDVASLSLPATEVGGDYYDYFSVDETRMAVVVGDVAGHGLASGLVLSGVRSGLNMLETELAAPAEALSRLNRMLVRTTPRGMIVTLLLTVLDRESRTVLLANAGNPPPLRYDAASGAVEELTAGSLPLGARGDATWEQSTGSLAPGDALLLFTDGVAEIADPSGRQYGYARVSQAFAEACQKTSAAKEVRDELLQDAWTFKGAAEQIDDVTLVVLRRKER